MISFAFRATVCKCNGIDQQFAGNVLARLDKENPLTEQTFWQAITFGTGNRTFPNNNDFQAALVNIGLQDRIKKDGFKYLLYSLERAADSQNLPAYSEVAVEQILPKKPNAAWKKYLATRNDSSNAEQWTSTLGNQTLVNGSDKGRGDLFDKKKIRYALSSFSYTKALSGYSHWTSKQIQARAKNLAAAALKVWTLPEEFNATIKDVAEIFNLDSNFNAFTSTHPATLSIFSKEKKCRIGIIYCGKLCGNFTRLTETLSGGRRNLKTSDKACFQPNRPILKLTTVFTCKRAFRRKIA